MRRVAAVVVAALGALAAGRWRAGRAQRRADAERRIAELERELAAHRESSERYRLLVDGLGEGIVLHSASGRIEACNPAAARILGMPAEEIVGRDQLDPVWKIVRADGTPFPGDELPATLALRTGRPQTDVVLGVDRPDGGRAWLVVNAQPIEEPARGTRVVVTGFIDVTARREAEEALRRTEDQLRQAQKMEAVGQLAGGVAHDFNNLLTVITSYTDLVLHSFDADDPRREDLGEVKRASARAAALTRQLLAFSRQQVLRPERLDLNAVVRESEKMLRRLIGEDVELVTRLAPEVRPVFADAGQLEQVIMNLALNARDAMPDGGVLVIETADVDVDEEFARQYVGASVGPHVMLSVTDSGHGMDAETRARAFEPFFTTKGPGRGTGLGLSTVYGIVKQSGGSVWAYSEPGRCTTIRIVLPVHASGDATPRVPTPRSTPVFAAGPAPDRGGATVLLVEDEASLRQVSRSVLLRAGFAVLEARDGEEALRLLDDLSRRVDLVVSDLVMPRAGGRDVALAAARVRPGVPTVLMSGYTEDATLRRGALPPGAIFLPKPFSPGELVDCVQGALTGVAQAGDSR